MYSPSVQCNWWDGVIVVRIHGRLQAIDLTVLPPNVSLPPQKDWFLWILRI